MEKGTIVRLNEPDVDDIVYHFSGTDYPVYGVVRRGHPERPSCSMLVHNQHEPNRWSFTGWFISVNSLEIVEEP